jgi:pimeloyl-ACP methyl ester carboxylesterase
MKTLLLIPGTQCDDRLWSKMPSDFFKEIKAKHWAIPQLSLNQTLLSLHQLLIKTTNDGNVVVGFSLGGYLVAKYIKEYGDYWQKDRSPTFIIVGNSAKSLPPQELATRSKIIANLNPNSYLGASRQRICQLLSQKHHQSDELVTLIQNMDRSLGPTSLQHQLSFTGEREDCLLALNQAAEKLSISMITSANDPLVDYAWLGKLSSNIKRFQVGQAGHMLPLEYPVEFSQTLTSIMRNDGFA